MARRQSRKLSTAGLGDLRLPGSALEGRLRDCDKAIFLGDTWRQWPGAQRLGERLIDSGVYGSSDNATFTDHFGTKHPQIQILSLPPSQIRRGRGHGLACVDRNGATNGRVLSLAHAVETRDQSESIGQPVSFVNGLNDIEVRGIWRGTTAKVIRIEIDGVGTPDTFRWTDEAETDPIVWNEETVEITGDWQALGIEGLEVRFGATTGHGGLNRYLYAGVASGLIVRLNETGFTRTDAYIASGSVGAVSYAHGGTIDRDQNFAYYWIAGRLSADTSIHGAIAKVNLSTFTIEAYLEQASAGGVGKIILDPSGDTGYAIAGNYIVDGVAPGAHVIKFGAASMTQIAALQITAADERVAGAAMSEDGAYLYILATGQTINDASLTKIDLQTFTEVATVDLTVTGQEETPTGLLVSHDGVSLYTLHGGPGTVTTIRRHLASTLAYASTLTLSAGENGALTWVQHPTDNTAYVGCWTEPMTIVKVNLSAMTRTSAVTMSAGENKARSCCLDSGGGLLYFGTDTAVSPGKIVKVETTGFTRVGVVTLSSGEAEIQDLIQTPELKPYWVIVAGERPQHLGFLRRQTAHDYPVMTSGVTAGGEVRTLIATAFDEVKSHGGSSLRNAGIRAPQIKPIVTVNTQDGSNPTGTPTAVDLGDTDNAALQWTGLNSVTASISTDPPEDQSQTRAISLSIPSAKRAGGIDLGYRAISPAVSIASTIKTISVWLRIQMESGALPANTLSLILSTQAAIGGTVGTQRIELPVSVALAANVWTRVDVPWSRTTSFSCASVGVKLVGSIPQGQFTVTVSTVNHVAGSAGATISNVQAAANAKTQTWTIEKIDTIDWTIGATGAYEKANVMAVTGSVSGQLSKFNVIYPTSAGQNAGLIFHPQVIGIQNSQVSFTFSTGASNDISGTDQWTFTVTNNSFSQTVALGVSKFEYPTGAIASDTLTEEGFWGLCFTWYDPETGRESAPSPISDLIALNGSGILAELAGVYPGIQAGLKNSPPAGISAVRIYLTNTTWEKDPRKGGQGFTFRLISPVAGLAIADLPNLPTVGTPTHSPAVGNGTITRVSASAEAPAETWTITCTAAPSAHNATFSVVGSVSGAKASVSLPGTSGGSTDYDNGLISFTLTDGGTDFDNAPTADVFTIVVTASPYTHGEIVVRYSDEEAKAFLNDDGKPQEPFFNGVIPACRFMVEDGTRIFFGDSPAYRPGGRYVFEKGSSLVTVQNEGDSGIQVILGAWMEGRELRRIGDDRRYVIIKAMDTDDDGELDALWIGADFDSDKQIYTTPYQGVSGAAEAEILGQRQTIGWTNVTSDRGVDIETSSALARREVFPFGDELVGGGKVGEFIYALGKLNGFVFRQNSAAADDDLTGGEAYGDPVHLRGIGMMARRTWVNRKDGTALFVGARGELYIATGAGIGLHPASDRLASILSGRGLLHDTRKSRHMIAAVKEDGEQALLYVGFISGFDEDDGSREPGVIGKSQDTFAFTASSDPFAYDADTAATDANRRYDNGALTGDFCFGVLIDLKTGEVFTGSDLRFTCAMAQGGSSAATAPGQLDGPVIMGDRDGFIHLALEETLLSLGSPTTRFHHTAKTADPGDSRTITVDPSDLAVGENGEGLLAGLLVAKLTPSTGVIEYRRIGSNTADTITLAGLEEWDADPTTGDVAIVGPIHPMIHWGEMRGPSPMVMRQIEMDLTQEESADTDAADATIIDPALRVDIFSASGSGTKVDISEAAATKRFNASDAIAKSGLIDLPPVSSRGLGLRLSWAPAQTGEVKIRELQVIERVPGEAKARAGAK